MLTRSTINPKSIWVRRIDKTSNGLVAIFRVRWNVHTVEVVDIEDELHTEYEYDEEELNCVLPSDVESYGSLGDYFKTNKTKLVTQAKGLRKMELAKPQPKPNPWYTDIESVRTKAA